MRHHRQTLAALALGSALAVGACGKGHDAATTNTAGGDVATPANPSMTTTPTTTAPMDTAPAKHHSKLGGALAGAAVGHVMGGHAVAGAAAGALIQHERNKHRRY